MSNIYKTHYRLAFSANRELFVRGKVARFNSDGRIPEDMDPRVAHALIEELSKLPVVETGPDEQEWFDALCEEEDVPLEVIAETRDVFFDRQYNPLLKRRRARRRDEARSAAKAEAEMFLQQLYQAA